MATSSVIYKGVNAAVVDVNLDDADVMYDVPNPLGTLAIPILVPKSGATVWPNLTEDGTTATFSRWRKTAGAGTGHKFALVFLAVNSPKIG